MGAEGVEPLGEVAEDDRHDLDHHVGDRGVDVQSADEQSQPEVVDADIDRDDLCVAEELLASVNAGVSERDVASQIEPGEEGDDEGDEERQNRCRNDDEPEIFPLDEYVTGLYNATRQQMNIVGLFALLAIVIALMGVFGIVMIETQYRRTEIAVRKVYGATTSQMIGMLNRRYAIIVAACFLVAAPVAWYITSRWLEQFTRRIAVPWWIFAAALAAVLAITMALITLRSWRAASENPANVIKSN